MWSAHNRHAISAYNQLNAAASGLILAVMTGLRFREKLVFVNYSSDWHFCVHQSIIDANHLTFATHSNTLGKSNFRREREGKFYGRAGRHGRVQIETNAPRTDVTRLCGKRYDT